MATENGIGTGTTEIEWNATKLKEYFTACQTKYNAFFAMSDSLIKAFQTYIDDSEHTGEEAESSKAFMSEVQIPLIEDIIYTVQLMEDMQNEMMTAFGTDVDSAESAILKTERLENIIRDFAEYNSGFQSISSQISSIAEGLNSNCSEAGSFTEPDVSAVQSDLDGLVTEDTLGGLVPELKTKFEAFDAEHSGDIAGSELDQMCALIEHNLAEVLSTTDSCLAIDITTFQDTEDKLDLMSAAEVLTGTQLEDYETFIENMNQYLQGKKERCEVYKYDPVNMCTGNYINEHDDIRVGGAYPLSFHRFYNAQSEEIGILGKGWSHSYMLHVRKTGEKEIKVTYPDGSSGTYREVKKGNWEEEHGEPGILEERADGYTLRKDSGEYHAFQADGYLTEMGDGNGRKYRILYDGIQGMEQETTVEEEQSWERRIAQVVSENGSSLSFAYDAAGHLCQIMDHTGRKVSYEYDEQDHLCGITEADGAIRKFGYSKEGQINSVTGPAGHVTIQNHYDKKGRVTLQEFADGGEMSYKYDDRARTTTATEQNGNRVIYGRDAQGRHIYTKYYDGEERFRYNRRNQKIAATDKNGNTTRYSYDRAGHLTGIVDAEGKRTSITYNTKGKPYMVKDPSGGSWRFTYDLAGNLFETMDPEGNKTRYYYTDGKLSKIRDAEKNDTFLEMDEAGNIIGITDPNGVRTRYEYDGLGRVIRSVDMSGNVTQFSYDAADRITQVRGADGSIKRYSYNAGGKVIGVTQADGSRESWEYNKIGKVYAYTDQEGNRTTMTYNRMWKQEEIVLPNGGKIHYSYDPLSRISSMTDPEGNQTSYRYDREGHIIEVKTAEDTTVSFAYDQLGRKSKITDGKGNTTQIRYGINGKAEQVTDAEGNSTRFVYDALGRTSQVIDAFGRVSRRSYTALGKTESIQDASGKEVRYHYEKGGRLGAVFFNGKIRERYQYDVCGRVAARILSDGYEITYHYDCMGRIDEIRTTTGRIIRYSYDLCGRVICMDDCGSQTHYGYGRRGKLEQVTDAEGNQTFYRYDALGKLVRIERGEEGRDLLKDQKETAQISQEGRVTLYDRDLCGRVWAVTDALGQKEIYQYDKEGRMIRKQDREGYETSFAYDCAGNLERVKYADGKEVELSYDALQRLDRIKDWTGETKILKDALGRAISVTDAEGRTVSYGYGPVGERQSITYPDGHQVSYDYDEEGQLRSLKDNGQEIRYSWDTEGRLTEKSYPNGTASTYEYLPGGYLKSLINRDQEGVMDRYSYQYDARGNKTRIERTRKGMEEISGIYEYCYDKLERLSGVYLGEELLREYHYDSFGNRTMLKEGENITTYSYDVLDRLLDKKEDRAGNILETRYQYDRRGNLTGAMRDEEEIERYQFDMTNHMVQAEDLMKGKDISYQYNGLGQRIKSEQADCKIEYLLDLTRSYHNMLGRYENGEECSFAWDWNVVSMTRGEKKREGKTNFYLQDELGSPMRLTGTDGGTIASYAYDEFGREISWAGTSRRREEQKRYIKEGNILQPFAFTGYQKEETGDLYFAQARYYGADAGRFVSEDKVRGFIEAPHTMNHYSYCWNRPVSYVDRDGQFPTFLKDIADGVINAWNQAYSEGYKIGTDIRENEVGEDIELTNNKIAVGNATFEDGAKITPKEGILNFTTKLDDSNKISESWELTLYKASGFTLTLSGENGALTSLKFVKKISIVKPITGEKISLSAGVSINNKGLNLLAKIERQTKEIPLGLLPSYAMSGSEALSGTATITIIPKKDLKIAVAAAVIIGIIAIAVIKTGPTVAETGDFSYIPECEEEIEKVEDWAA